MSAFPLLVTSPVAMTMFDFVFIVPPAMIRASSGGIEVLPVDVPSMSFTRYVCDEAVFRISSPGSPITDPIVAKSVVTDPIREQFSVSGVYGLIIIERGEASLGVLKNGRITESYNKQSGVMGKTRAGGQSAQRFARERERQKHEFFESIANTAQSMFEGHDIDGVALGGTTHTVGEFEDYLWHNVNLIGKYPVEYANTEALEDLVEQALDQLEEAASADAIDAVSEFFKGLRDGMSEYGPEQVERALEMGAVNTLLLSTKLDSERIRELERLADQRGSGVVVFTPSFEEGERFQKLTDGVGATLRFQV